MADRAVASVVIPAHNEGAVIARCLDALLAQNASDQLEVVVVANGCTDDTVVVASSFMDRLPGLRVLERAEPGKIGALNAGDAAVAAFPRIYLDADIELGVGSLGDLITTLTTEVARVASPAVAFDAAGASRVVSWFYEVFEQLPYAGRSLIGLGVYGVSRAGRQRFDVFPEVTADDLFVQRLFTEAERRTTAGSFLVRTPRTARDLVAVRTRVARGNAELAVHGDSIEQNAPSTRSTLRSLAAAVLGSPTLGPAAAVYIAVTMVARAQARRSSSAVWLRDESSRPLSPPPQVQDPPAGVDVGGVVLSALTQAETVEHVMAELDEGRGGMILTPNIDIMRQLGRQPGRDLAARASVVVADGMPIVWASRIQGTPLPERVTGADLVWSLSKAAAAAGRTVYLLGGAPGVAQRAGEALDLACGGLRIAGCLSPPMGFDKDPDQLEDVLRLVSDARPDLVFVALGFPKQELLAQRLLEVLPQAWFLGCGGALDMAAGDVSRAPGRLQSFGGEWLHRLAKEPRRLFRRYVVDDIPYALTLLARSTARRARAAADRS